MKFEKVRILFPIAITLHNLEEAIWLPDFSQTIQIKPLIVTREQFWLGSIVLTVLAYVVMLMSLRTGRQSLSTYVLMGYAFAMSGNVIFPHIIATIVLKRYAPGLITSLFIIAPTMIALWKYALEEEYIYLRKGIKVSLLVTVGLLILISMIFVSSQLFFRNRG